MDMSITGSGQIVHYHTADKCAGMFCPFHNPSAHHMRSWPLHFRPHVMERLCPHRVGHPDPDSLAYMQQFGADVGVHGCDGCCSVPEELHHRDDP